MKDLFLRRLNEEKSALEGVNKALERGSKFYAKRQQEMKSAGMMGDTKGVSLAQAKMNALQVSTAGQLAKKQDIQETLKAMQDDPSIRNRLAGIVAGVAAASEIVQVGATTYQRAKTLTEANVAASYAPQSMMARGLMGGDISSLAAIASPDALAKFQQASGTGAPILSMLGGIGAKIGGGAAAGSMAGPWGALAGGFGGLIASVPNIQNLIQGGAGAAQGEAMAKQIQNLRGENFMTDVYMQDLQAKAASREAASLRLGGRGGMMRAIGGGFGLGTTESITGNAMGLEQAIGLPGARGLFGNMFGLQKGRAGVNIANEPAINLLSGMSMGTGGAGAAGKNAEELMTRVFSNAFKNARVGEEIGNAIGTVMQQSERVSGTNALNVALANLPSATRFMTGRNMDMMDAKHIKGGLGVVEDVFHRGGAFEAMRLAVARSVISKTSFGKSPIAEYMVSGLSQMSAKDVMSGATNPLTDLMGGPSKQNTASAKGILNQFKNQEMSRTLQMLFHNDPGGLVAKITGGGDIATGFAGLRPAEAVQFKRMLQTRVNNPNAVDADYLMGMGMLTSLTGVRGGGRGKATNLGGGLDAAFLASQTGVEFKTMGEEGRSDAVKSAIKNATAVFQTTIDIFKSGADPAEKFNMSLKTMVELMNGVSPEKVQQEIMKWEHERAIIGAKRGREMTEEIKKAARPDTWHDRGKF